MAFDRRTSENSDVFPAGSVAVAVTTWSAPVSTGRRALNVAFPAALVVTVTDPR